jgi:hypothetical protein
MSASTVVFATVAQARAAVYRDGLATVYRNARTVFVATAFGTGTFTSAEWDAQPADTMRTAPEPGPERR